MIELLQPHEIYKRAPAVYASKSGHRTSNRYGFTPTSRILDILSRSGWYPHAASQVRSTRYEATGTHMVRLVQAGSRNRGTILNDLGAEPEIIVINDHNGRKKFQIHAGVFRFACANGLIVASTGFDKVVTKHCYGSDQAIIDAVRRIQTSFSGISHKILMMQCTKLGQSAKSEFAASALRYRYGDLWKEAPVTPQQLLEPKRPADISDDLWTVYNVVQENAIRGGIKTEHKTSDGKQRSRFYRGINSPPLRVEMNKRLWKQALWMLETNNA